jgi:malonyl-CoA/methylmalonyl-CoA synthetase
MTLTDLFDLSLAGRRDQVGIEFGEKQYTFGEMDARSNRMARLLQARGFAAGDRLCVQLANAVEMVDLYLACVKLGVIFVPINVLYKEREVNHIVGDAEPRAVVGPEEARELAREAARLEAERPRIWLEGETPAAIIYTSGTTGKSKGAVLTHNNLAANAVNLLAVWQITSADRLLLVLPLFHVHGLGNGLHCWLLSGCRLRLEERFDHQRAAEMFLGFRPTLFFGVPTIYVRLLEAPAEIAASMRLFVSGSAPLAPQVLEGFRHKFGHVILERYGMTEALMITSNPYAGERRAGTVGKPLPGVAVRLGENGEAYARGPNVFAGYWRQPEETREAFEEGWFRTGDLAERSEDGYYTLRGRRSDLIISGGFNIYPREIEELLLEQEGVAEAAVVGVPDPARGEIPVAFLVPRGAGFDPVRLEQVCREKLASFKTPRRFVAVDKLPRTALGKVQKHLLVQ